MFEVSLARAFEYVTVSTERLTFFFFYSCTIDVRS